MRILVFALCCFFLGCSGGTTTNNYIQQQVPPDPVKILAPTNLVYSSSKLVYKTGVPILPLVPSVTGTITAYTVAPSLPDGLILTQTTGVITGIPMKATSSQNYIVTATNSSGSTTTTLTIQVKGTPSIIGLTAIPQSVTYGKSSTLFWSTDDPTATFTIVPDVPSYTGSTSVYVTPTITTRYTITAKNEVGSSSADVTVVVLPVIGSFVASSYEIFVGESVTLSWSLGGVTNVTMNLNMNDVRLFGTSLTVSPTTTTTYVLKADNESGHTEMSLTVIVKVRPPKKIGLYINGGWLYDYPLSTHTWQRSDYQKMFKLMKLMGYDSTMIWPLLETIPMPLSSDDSDSLRAFKLIIQDSKDLGLTTWISQCANITTDPSIRNFPFQSRNPYPRMKTIRFYDYAAGIEYLNHRRAMLSILNNADAYVTIDGDPGSYEGAPAQDFVNIFLSDKAAVGSAKVIPWIWTGWGQPHPWALPVEPLVRAELSLLVSQIPGIEIMPGRLPGSMGCGRINMSLTQEFNLEARSTIMMYDTIEPEPIAPSPVNQFDIIRSSFSDEQALINKGANVMGEIQTPLMQLPGIYFYAKIAHDVNYGNKTDDEIFIDCANFLGGDPSLLLPAWKCYDLALGQIPVDLANRIRSSYLYGEAANDIPGGSTTYLNLLATQVESRRRFLAAMALPHTTDTESSAAIIEAIDSLVYWWNHHHYVSGNDPGAPFTLQYVHPSQMDALKYWANAIVFNKTNASNLIIQGLVKRGTVNGSVATQVVNEMFGVKVN